MDFYILIYADVDVTNIQSVIALTGQHQSLQGAKQAGRDYGVPYNAVNITTSGRKFVADPNGAESYKTSDGSGGRVDCLVYKVSEGW